MVPDNMRWVTVTVMGDVTGVGLLNPVYICRQG
jgi:hypothetical protein